jgi:hypothetical protein
MESCYRAEGHMFAEDEKGIKVCIWCGRQDKD